MYFWKKASGGSVILGNVLLGNLGSWIYMDVTLIHTPYLNIVVNRHVTVSDFDYDVIKIGYHILDRWF